MVDRSIIACMPWIQDSAELVRNLLFGATKATCADCGTDVMISPAGKRVSERTGAEAVCLRCAQALEKDHELEFEIAPEVRAAVREMTGKEPEEIIPPGMSLKEGIEHMRKSAERRQNS